MHLDGDILHDLDRALATEWLLTDGAGGYASSTVLGCGTRRYHGLWVPALRPPVDRRVVFSHVEERLVTHQRETFLSTTEYGAGFFPDGSPWAATFDLDPLPRFTARVDDLEIEREVLLLPHGQGVCLTYRVRGGGAWTLEVAPMLALRSMHAMVHRHDSFHVESLGLAPGFRCLTDRTPGVFLWTDAPGAEAAANPLWYFGVLRRVERRRGFDHFEDVLMPGRWTFRGDSPAEWHVFCSFEPPRRIDAEAARQAYLGRQTELLVHAGSPADVRVQRLVRAADAFLVRRRADAEELATVIAGYHWFGDWGRDAMIALPGLAIETGRLNTAEKVLRAFAAATSDGMIPNQFLEESGQPEYNTVDASLWFIQAVAAYLRGSGRKEFVREYVWKSVTEILRRYRSGTRFGIHADTDGLIVAGSPETQLTWMDARAGGKPVTPRYGKAVEINALWISGLALACDMAADLGEPAPVDADTIARARDAFRGLFWNADAGCLYDCLLPDGTRDAAVRPNQILAVGLPHAPLGDEMARAVVAKVRERLLTPRGLRTLDPDHPAYRGKYAGSPFERDSAYHQGTVWPWLLGPYVDAVFAVESPEIARAEATEILDGLLDSMETGCLGQINEIFDGDPPQRPVGAAAQAWSVGAAIHIWRRLEGTA